MIRTMLLRLAFVVTVALSGSLGAGCGEPTTGAKEPQTAKDKQLADMKAAGELDDKSENRWQKWRYSGDRKDCKFVLGRRCFKTEKLACDAAKCGAVKCESTGAGPATVACHGQASHDPNPEVGEKKKPPKKAVDLGKRE